MNVAFWPAAWEDYPDWQKHNDKLLHKRHARIDGCRRHPFEGTGKPEPPGGDLPGWRSRQISHEYRLVYRVAGSGKAQVLQVVQSRYHC